MRQPISRFRLLAGLLLLLGSGLAGADQLQSVLDQVSQSNYTHYLNDLLSTHNGDNRGPQAPQHDAARVNLQSAFASFGLTTSLAPFQYEGATYYNVVAVLEGKLRPGEYHVIGAHYDSVNNPGADDDASGVAGLLEAARVASMHDFGTTIVFIAFDREEAGLLGSKSWATEHAGDRILGMVQMDMIAFNPEGLTHNLVALCPPDSEPNSTYTALYSAIALHSGGLTPVYGGVSTGSDHASFARLAPSVLMIEASFHGNGNYHKAADSVDTPHYVDYAYASAVTRSTVAYLAAQAGLLPETTTTARFSPAGIANAASLVVGPAAASEVITLTGAGLSYMTEQASGVPLGLTLGGTTVMIRDSSGAEQAVPLTYVSPHQISLVMPETVALGPATFTVARADGAQVSAGLRLEAVTPGLFTLDSSGSGAATAQAARLAPGGAQFVQNLFVCGDGGSGCSSVPVGFGAEDDLVTLVLYGTGIRGRSGLAGVSLDIEGQKLPAQYAGAQPAYPGLDQVNVALPRTLRGRGQVSITLWVDGKAANPVVIDLGPQ